MSARRNPLLPAWHISSDPPLLPPPHLIPHHRLHLAYQLCPRQEIREVDLRVHLLQHRHTHAKQKKTPRKNDTPRKKHATQKKTNKPRKKKHATQKTQSLKTSLSTIRTRRSTHTFLCRNTKHTHKHSCQKTNPHAVNHVHLPDNLTSWYGFRQYPLYNTNHLQHPPFLPIPCASLAVDVNACCHHGCLCAGTFLPRTTDVSQTSRVRMCLPSQFRSLLFSGACNRCLFLVSKLVNYCVSASIVRLRPFVSMRMPFPTHSEVWGSKPCFSLGHTVFNILPTFSSSNDPSENEHSKLYQ